MYVLLNESLALMAVYGKLPTVFRYYGLQCGETDMRYAVRKRDGRWAVFAGDMEVLRFDEYVEAIDTALRAAIVMQPTSAPTRGVGACARRG